MISILKKRDPHAEVYVLTAPYFDYSKPDGGRILVKQHVVQVNVWPPVSDVYIINQDARDYLQEAEAD